jgi:short subunit dehydrogenase-like uncharacterized protein
MKIAVYGANGFQGKLVVTELARRDIDMVLVGRSADRLKSAAAEAGVAGTEVRVADTDDHDGLVAAFRVADGVINCAGPFTLSGAAVVRATVAAGRHYTDTSGEQLHIKQIYDTFMADAERAGVTVIPAMTDGGVPGDLLAHLLAERIGPLQEITTAHKIVGGGGMSRGSLRSLLETVEVLKSGGLSYEDGEWLTDTPTRRTSIVFPGDSEPIPVVKFALQEVITVPRHVRVRHVQGLAEAGLSTRLSTPFTTEVIDSLPEGPAEDNRRTQRFTIVVDAVGEDGRHARGLAEGPDTYGTTAVIAAEGTRRLIVDGAPAGVLAPAQAFDPADFLDSLAPHGTTWSVDSRPARPAHV